jgi:hypothetical protein
MTQKGKQATGFDPAMLPKELQRYGQPLSIHSPWAAALEDVQRKLLAAFGGLTWNPKIVSRSSIAVRIDLIPLTLRGRGRERSERGGVPLCGAPQRGAGVDDTTPERHTAHEVGEARVAWERRDLLVLNNAQVRLSVP